MVKIGTFEAKAHFSSLLDRVANGEEFTITKHGKAIARLVGAEDVEKETPEAAFSTLKDLRSKNSLAGISWKALRDEGRK